MPEAFAAWNRHRAAQGAHLRAAIAEILRETPALDARGIRCRLLATGVLPRQEPNGHLAAPRLRAIQLHMAAIRDSQWTGLMQTATAPSGSAVSPETRG